MSQVSQTGWQIFVEVPGKAPIELPAGESVIGRSRACTVQIAESTVSRQHAIFVVEPGKVKLRDLGSSNGTFVNGQRVDGEMALGDGDRVVVGEAEIVLRMLAPLGPADATARLSIPPLSSPQSAPTASPPAVPAWASAPLPEAPGGPHRIGQAPGSSSHFAPMPTPAPAARTPTPPALHPAAVPAPQVPASHGASTPAPPAEPAPKSGELLSSIRDIDLAPVPPPLPQQRKVTVIDKAEPAGFWLRVAAALLDSIPFLLLAAIQIAVAFFISPRLSVLVSLLEVAYGLLVMLVLPALKGITPGKKLMKLAIVSETTVAGQGLGWGTAALRLVGYLVCSLTFGLGYLLVAFSARKQGLHDLIAKTNVVRKR